jgi:hypothetical protein
LPLLFNNDSATQTAQHLASVATFPSPGTVAAFSFWVNVTSLAIINQRFWGNANNFECRTDNSTFKVFNDLFTTVVPSVGSVTTLSVGPWFHVAGNSDFTGGLAVADIYINGVFQAALSPAGSAIAAATMTIGNRTSVGLTEGMKGSLDDLRLYNRKLSAAEILTIYSTRGTDNIVHGLILRTPMDEGEAGASPVFSIGNAGFETPNVGIGALSYVYSPPNASWTFSSGSGVAGNSSDFTSGNAVAPAGTQVGFLQSLGTFSQLVLFNAGTFNLSFLAAQRINFQPGGNQTIEIRVDGVLVSTHVPIGGSYTLQTSSNFTVTTGFHTVKFSGLTAPDSTAFLDSITLNHVSSPPSSVKDISNVKNDYMPTGKPVYVGSVLRSRRRLA